MKVCSGRWRVALGMGAALAIASGFTTPARAGERGKIQFPWRKPASAAPTTIPQATPRGDIALLPEALTLEDESPLSAIVTQDSPKPPASSTGQVPSPPPPLQKQAPLPSGSFAPPASGLTPVPNDMGEVLGGPIAGEMMHGDAFPLYYRDRPTGSKKTQAEIISRNRGSEHEWYKEWRCKHYGYYPTQWRPWPEGWHVGRNIPPAPYVHPYDLKQPDPDLPEGKRPTPPRSVRESQRDQGRDAVGPAPKGTPNRNEPAPPLQKTPAEPPKKAP